MDKWQLWIIYTLTCIAPALKLVSRTFALSRLLPLVSCCFMVFLIGQSVMFALIVFCPSIELWNTWKYQKSPSKEPNFLYNSPPLLLYLKYRATHSSRFAYNAQVGEFLMPLLDSFRVDHTRMDAPSRRIAKPCPHTKPGTTSQFFWFTFLRTKWEFFFQSGANSYSWAFVCWFYAKTT